MTAGLNLPKYYIILIIAFSLSVLCTSKSVHKRDLLQLCRLISIHSNRSCWDYNDYGCYCGYGQVGGKPVDAIDTCCKIHDTCYGESSCFFWAQIIRFAYTCDEAKSDCQCTDPTNTCSRQACDCDLELARCLRHTNYSEVYRNFDRRQCYMPNSWFLDE